MEWSHSAMMSTAQAGTAVVVIGDDGWEAFPFGLDGGSSGIYPTREQAIDSVESTAGDVACCVGHLAEDSDRQLREQRAERQAATWPSGCSSRETAIAPL